MRGRRKFQIGESVVITRKDNYDWNVLMNGCINQTGVINAFFLDEKEYGNDWGYFIKGKGWAYTFRERVLDYFPTGEEGLFEE